jgi:uncharacterized protein YjiS (DUF1127 family)
MSTQNIHIDASPLEGIAQEKLKSASSAAVAAGKGIFWTAVAEFIRYRAFKVAEARLNDLDDRMLKDIGLNRSEIKSALLNVGHERINGARYFEPPIV